MPTENDNDVNNTDGKKWEIWPYRFKIVQKSHQIETDEIQIVKTSFLRHFHKHTKLAIIITARIVVAER